MRGRKAEIIEGITQNDFDKLSKTQGKSFTETAAAIRVELRVLRIGSNDLAYKALKA